MMNSIVWPAGYLPGETDNFCSNEVIVKGLSTAEVWSYLVNADEWPSYYANSANVCFHDGKGPVLADGDRFYFETFGFPVEGQCNEYVAPADGQRQDHYRKRYYAGWHRCRKLHLQHQCDDHC